MRKRMTIVAAGALLCAGAIAAAQAPPYTVQADRINRQITWDLGSKAATPVQTTFVGNVVLVVNGVTVRADRAVVKDGEVQLEGNVRLTLPATK